MSRARFGFFQDDYFRGRMVSNYDVAVIGSGPGGYVAAIRAGQLGLKTAIIEKESLGGVCLNWGCIPSKALLKNAEILSYIDRAEEFGLSFDNFHADYSVAISRSRKVVDLNTKGVDFLLKKNKVDQFQGTGKLAGPGKVEVAPDGTIIEAKNIILATGSRPRSIPPLPIDGDRVITSRESIVLADLPSSIVIVGGGAIGVEFAYIYRMYGVEVTVVELLPRLVPNEDEDISAQLERSFRKHGINVLTGAGVTGVETKSDGVTVTVEQDGAAQSLECDKVLVAIGVQPNVEGLGLEELSIATDKTGIVVDEVFSTNVPGVYAIGDAAGGPQFTHVAGYHAGVIIRSILLGLPSKARTDHIPRATYTDPEMAQVGLTEAEAREIHGAKLQVVRAEYSGNDRAVATGQTPGLIKVMVVRGRPVGASIVGAQAGELIQTWALAIANHLKMSAIAAMVAPYPTLGEINKRAAGAYFSPKLFENAWVKRIVRVVQRL